MLANLNPSHDLTLGETTLDLSSRCHVMGILNVTPDSFSDGGHHADTAAAVEHALRMEAEGAAIIDIGGESTRPGAPEVSADVEHGRVIPVIEGIRRHSRIPVSVDTRKSVVARAALQAGADMINDVSALRHDAEMTALATQWGVPVVLMHMQGDPRSMQARPQYEDVVENILAFFHERIRHCHAHGIRQIVVDPGIGFGKTLTHNLALLRALPRFTELGFPILIGTSRKSFIGSITGLPVDQRLPGTIASNILACQNGARLLRVHDVGAVRAALDVVDAIDNGVEVSHAV